MVTTAGRPFDGVRVVEVAAWTFVPGAGAVMADLGADVIKIEPPTGDPQRGLMNLMNQVEGAPNPFIEIPNRGKRSVTLDLKTPGGRELLLRLVATADVFLTSYLPRLRERMRIDVEDLRAVNPRLVYVRGSGWGSSGPKVDVGGYDAAAAWAGGGAMYKLTEPQTDNPAMQPAAFYDLQGSSYIAGAVAMALFRRERTGEGGVVDVSLLNAGMWSMSPDIVAAPYTGELFRADRKNAGNPIASFYRTSDDRWISLVCLQSDRFWPELCGLLGRPELAADPRYADQVARYKNRRECIQELDTIFGAKTLEEWKKVLAGFSGVWSAAQSFAELHADEQVAANGFLSEVSGGDGRSFRLVAPPYQFDGEPSSCGRAAPELGQHTEEVLLELGMEWDDITAQRESGALG
ncbi:MAG TPA: CoA transferase [Mycobacteriales bacterium]|nr:CoA transferase [Mycobacteriales bacterium]